MKKVAFFIILLLNISVFKANAQKGSFFSEFSINKINLNSELKYQEAYSWVTKPRKGRLINANSANSSAIFSLYVGYKYYLSEKINIISKVGTPINITFHDEIFHDGYGFYLFEGQKYSTSFMPATLGINYKIIEQFKAEVDFTYGIKLAENKDYYSREIWGIKSNSFYKYSIKGVYSHKNHEVYIGLDLLKISTPSLVDLPSITVMSGNNSGINNSNSISVGYRYNFLDNSKNRNKTIKQF